MVVVVVAEVVAAAVVVVVAQTGATEIETGEGARVDLAAAVAVEAESEGEIVEIGHAIVTGIEDTATTIATNYS